MKINILAISLSAALFLGVGVLSVYAQAYQPLAPLPQTFDPSTGTTNIEMYLSGAIKLIIALGAALSILFAIIGGTQYVAAGISPDAKSGAKERITNSLVGLGIILTSYLLLNSINPKLVEVGFNLKPIEGIKTVSLNSLIVSNSQSSLSTEYQGISSSAGENWQDDTSFRLRLNSGNILINKENCKKVGDENCTSVYALNSAAIDKLSEIRKNCGNCQITVTGGTEYWLHGNRNQTLGLNQTDHKPGNSVVDLSSSNSALNSAIRSGQKRDPGAYCSNLGEKWTYMGGTFVLEPKPEHWHVCF